MTEAVEGAGSTGSLKTRIWCKIKWLLSKMPSADSLIPVIVAIDFILVMHGGRTDRGYIWLVTAIFLLIYFELRMIRRQLARPVEANMTLVPPKVEIH